MKVRFARSATKHRVSRPDIEHVIDHCGLYTEQPAPSDSDQRDPRLVFLGDGLASQPLEVIAIELDSDTLLVIHAMALRKRYRDDYGEAIKWRR